MRYEVFSQPVTVLEGRKTFLRQTLVPLTLTTRLLTQ